MPVESAVISLFLFDLFHRPLMPPGRQTNCLFSSLKSWLPEKTVSFFSPLSCAFSPVFGTDFSDLMGKQIEAIFFLKNILKDITDKLFLFLCSCLIIARTKKKKVPS